MTSKTPTRSMEDIDDKALSYGEIKALATGNPLILEKTQLDSDVAKLKLIRQSYQSQIYDLEDKIAKFYPQQIKVLQEKLQAYETDVECLKNKTVLNKDGFSKMTINGIEYTEKEQAGKAILEVCKNKTNPELEEIGTYRGFKLGLSFNSVEKEFVMTIKNEYSYNISLSTDIYGNITRINNALEKIEDKIPNVKLEIEDMKKQLESAKVEVQKPFSRENELKEKMEKLEEINIALKVDEKGEQILDTSDNEEPIKDPTEKDRDYEK